MRNSQISKKSVMQTAGVTVITCYYPLCRRGWWLSADGGRSALRHSVQNCKVSVESDLINITLS